jgi:hypothetical protein
MTRRWLQAALTLTLAVTTLGFAQDPSAVPPVAVSGQYRLTRVDVGPSGATMDFTASLVNPGDTDIAGNVLLRDPAVANRVFEDFGEQTIPARGLIRVTGIVTVPTEIYESWSKGDAPALFVNIEDERGSVAMHRVLLQRAPDRTPAG